MSLSPLEYRVATIADADLLAQWNHQLIQDEGHRNCMTVPELADRMRGFLASEYKAVIFARDGSDVAYALFRESASEIYLRQLFVCRDSRRQGIGRAAVGLLRSQVWPGDKRLTVEVLVANEAAVAFWRSVGFVDYALTLEVVPATESGY
jgi:GNAT superfamily N-acetyltransferase